MYKKIVRTLIVVGVLGFIAYKAYEYFVKKNDEDVIDEDFLDDDEFEPKPQETVVDKIKAVVQNVLG